MYKDCIQRTLDKIEANLKDEIDAEMLSQEAGYSLFHFYRIFQDAVGFPVMQYILRRKLLNAIYEIGTGRKKNVIVLKNGKNIYPEEIEALIDKIPYVAENVVMGEKEGDDYRLVAHVVYDPEAAELKGKSAEEIQAIADADIENISAEMPKYKRIKQVYLRTEPFEKTTTQKIKRRKVKTGA